MVREVGVEPTYRRHEPRQASLTANSCYPDILRLWVQPHFRIDRGSRLPQAERSQLHAQEESFSIPTPIVVGYLLTYNAVPHGRFLPPTVKSYCVAPQPVYKYIISYFNIFVKHFLGVSGKFFKFPPTFFQGRLSFRQVQGLR